jgi:hypothetical protein
LGTAGFGPAMELLREYGAGELNPLARVGDICGTSWSSIVRISLSVLWISSWDAPTRKNRILVCWENAREISGSLRGSARFGWAVEGVDIGVGAEERSKRTKRGQDNDLKASVSSVQS